MKLGTGIVRKIDELGRIVLPKEMRKVLDIKHNDYIEMRMEGSNIVLHKYENRCVFCGEINPKYNFADKKMCGYFLRKIKNEL